MKFKKLILLFLFVICLGTAFCLVGCGDKTPSSDNNPNQPPENPSIETTYNVHINLNNSSYGSLIVDNLKPKYDEGDEITITVAPNKGYYLRGYSDCDSKELTRTITVTKSENITVNLVEGDACTFYGYHIAANCPVEQKILGATEKTSINQGGLTQFVKYMTNKNITSGNLALLAQDNDNFGYWEIRQNDKSEIITFPETSFNDYDYLIKEDYLMQIFGDKKTDWIDIIEHDTYCGNAFVLTRSDVDKDDICYEDFAEFNISLFANTNLYYIYSLNGNLNIKGLEKIEETYNASHLAETNKSCFIQTFRLFTVDEKIYFSTNWKNEYMIRVGQKYQVNKTINGENITIQFVTPQN